jgi:hypothetical protein
METAERTSANDSRLVQLLLPLKMASLFSTSPTSPRLTSAALLPPPPRRDLPGKEISQINRAVSQYYWPRHFEHATSCAPALFIDRIMTDYADHEDDPVGGWIVDMSPIYKVYKVCLKYGTENGSPGKAREAKSLQGVFQIFVFDAKLDYST